MRWPRRPEEFISPILFIAGSAELPCEAARERSVRQWSRVPAGRASAR